MTDTRFEDFDLSKYEINENATALNSIAPLTAEIIDTLSTNRLEEELKVHRSESIRLTKQLSELEMHIKKNDLLYTMVNNRIKTIDVILNSLTFLAQMADEELSKLKNSLIGIKKEITDLSNQSSVATEIETYINSIQALNVQKLSANEKSIAINSYQVLIQDLGKLFAVYGKSKKDFLNATFLAINHSERNANFKLHEMISTHLNDLRLSYDLLKTRYKLLTHQFLLEDDLPLSSFSPIPTGSNQTLTKNHQHWNDVFSVLQLLSKRMNIGEFVVLEEKINELTKKNSSLIKANLLQSLTESSLQEESKAYHDEMSRLLCNYYYVNNHNIFIFKIHEIIQTENHVQQECLTQLNNFFDVEKNNNNCIQVNSLRQTLAGDKLGTYLSSIKFNTSQEYITNVKLLSFNQELNNSINENQTILTNLENFSTKLANALIEINNNFNQVKTTYDALELHKLKHERKTFQRKAAKHNAANQPKVFKSKNPILLFPEATQTEEPKGNKVHSHHSPVVL